MPLLPTRKSNCQPSPVKLVCGPAIAAEAMVSVLRGTGDEDQCTTKSGQRARIWTKFNQISTTQCGRKFNQVLTRSQPHRGREKIQPNLNLHATTSTRGDEHPWGNLHGRTSS